MSISDLKKQVKDPRFIPGIYNFCDRWCERCSFTRRCLQYARELEEKNDPDSDNLCSDEFWRKINASLAQVLELLKEMAAENGIDLDKLKTQTPSSRYPDDQVRNHPLARRSFQYAKLVTRWFESHYNSFRQKQGELYQIMKLGIDRVTPRKDAIRISDAVEVIRWYQFQIHVKLVRALMPPLLVAEVEDDEADLRNADGSAKVALLGMDRSIGAWGELRNQLPEQADSILDILIHLDRVRRKTEKCFPNARHFIRPGFDDGSDPGWPPVKE